MSDIYPYTARWLASENERLVGQLDRMRAALAEANRRFLMEAANAGRALFELQGAQDTIACVRAVLDAADLSDRESGFYMDIRAALEGDE